MSLQQPITPCLWFDDRAEEAVAFYCSIFRRSKTIAVTRYSDVGKEIHGHDAGTVLTIDFEIDGQQFTALNGGPEFKFNEAISLMVHCDTQDEIDRYWDLLSEGGDPKAHQCGWLKDKFGVSWQIVPTALALMLRDSDGERAGRVMGAMLKMKKLDLAALKSAYG